MQAWKTPDKYAAYLIPSIADILFVCLLLFLSIAKGQALLADGDTGWHIRTGEFILRTHSVPKYDIFSFIAPPLPWTAHEWLSEVIMALVHKIYGLTGIVFFFAFVISLIYYLQFRILKSYGINILAVTAAMLLALMPSEVHWLARPHIFSLLFMLIWYCLMDDYQYRDKKYIFVLPLVMLVWVNLHAGFIIGFVICAIYLAGNVLQSLLAPNGGKAVFKRKAASICAVAAISLLASLANPRGYEVLLYPFRLTFSKFTMDHIIEFLSPDFHRQALFQLLIFFLIAVLALSKKRLNIIETALLAVFLEMSLYSVRYLPVFAIVATPILAKQVSYLLKESKTSPAVLIREKADGIAAIDGAARGFLWPALTVLLVAALIATGKLEYRFSEYMQPEKPITAVKFLQKVPVRGNMFNSLEFGDYVDYAAWPQYKVFFDGRMDMFGEKKFKEYMLVSSIGPGWRNILRKYNVNWIFFSADSLLCRRLRTVKGWKLIYTDKVADIFVRDMPEYRELIKKYTASAMGQAELERQNSNTVFSEKVI